MGMTSTPQCYVAVATFRIVLNGDPRPMVNRVPQTGMRGITPNDNSRLATLLRHWRNFLLGLVVASPPGHVSGSGA